jgi:hypothetical protein
LSEQKNLFLSLYLAPTEDEVSEIINSNPEIFINDNWFPFGGDQKFFGIIRGQQSSPIAAIVEKVTNSIDAILIRKCIESGIDPKTSLAPRTMYEALNRFFPNHPSWDLSNFRSQQSEEIQIIADGPPKNTSVIIYDNGEGQHPENFETTFLSLVRGNKLDIHFVQGKYNMGGSGALVFCGKNRYQLIGSKRFDNTGEFGFTICRQRKIGNESDQRRFSYFEYLKINNKIPSFDISEIDLKLLNRKFKTGTVIKLYSYQFPSGYSGFAQDLNQSLNEYLFEPILPIYTVDKIERYPNNRVLKLDLFGLKRRLEEDKKQYVDTSFSEEYIDEVFGKAKVTCYIFKPKLEDRNVKDSKKIIGDRFFRNNMSVLFSVNGQVQGSYTSEFITRTLKFNLLKDYLLIHCDCTDMNVDFREELFMSDRERLKGGEDSTRLRDYLGKRLRRSKLDEINRHRKESISLESEDTTELIKSFVKNLPKESELFKLLQNTLKLEEKKDNKSSDNKQKIKPQKEDTPINLNRFPTLFKLQSQDGKDKVINLPINGEKTIKFNTDVEDDYFDRIDEPGELQLALLKIKRNDLFDGDKGGSKEEISQYLNVVKSSPNKGIIRLTLNPTHELKVNDEIELKASLIAPNDLNEILLVRIVQPEAPKVKAPLAEDDLDNVGLPELKRVTKADWQTLEEHGISMNHDTVLYPVGVGDKLERIYVNLDSKVFLNHRSKLKTEDQITVAEKRYLSSVYFHSLFLYMITKRKKYNLNFPKEDKFEDVTVDEYIRDVFDSYYTDFLLNFGMENLMQALEN